LRLRIIPAGQSFSFICDPEHVEKMTRVIAHNGGAVVNKKMLSGGVFFTVTKRQDFVDDI